MFSLGFKIIYFIGIILIPSLVCSEVDGFDYPFGNKGIDDDNNKIVLLEHILSSSSLEDYNIEFHEYKKIPLEGNNERYGVSSSEWYNYNDVGNYYVNRNGIHPGEDWNLPGGDAGEDVYAIADGIVKKVSKIFGNNGYCIVLEHDIPKNFILNKYNNIKFIKNPDKIYSNYLHVTNMINEGEKVIKGKKIAEISNSLDYPHLHLEIATQNNSCGYPNGNRGSGRSGYYSHSIHERFEGSMGVNNTIKAMNYMKEDGFIDPSDFIEANRVLIDNSCEFSDINNFNDSYNAIYSLCKKGIIDGYSNTKNIKINKKINRSNWVKFISKSIKYVSPNEKTINDCNNTSSLFNDTNHSDWFCSFSKYLNDRKIIEGYDKEFIIRQNKNNINYGIPQDEIQPFPCEIYENNNSQVFCPNYRITYQEVVKTLFSSFLNVKPRDSYWKTPNNPYNYNYSIFQDINKIEAYIGCSDKIGLFKNNDSFSVINMHNKFITRERAFIALNNVISGNIKSPLTECNMDSK